MPSQIILDPSDQRTIGEWAPRGPIPSDLRKFGRFPDIATWQPGDLILVSAIRPSGVSSAIISTQTQGGYHQDDARWHHAAVYTGGEALCEATRHGVMAGLLYPYVGAHRLRIRRDPSITREQGWEIAVAAMTRLNTPYGFGSILKLKLQSLKGFWRGRSAHGRNAKICICSELYSDAYSWVTQKVLRNMAGDEVTPAFLSVSPALQDVQTNWLKIP